MASGAIDHVEGAAAAVTPAARLTAVLPLWLTRTIAVLALVLMIGLFCWACIVPQRFSSDLTRFMLCLGLSFCAGIFLFVFYPARYSMREFNGIKLPMKVVGPAALFLLLLFILMKEMPLPEMGRLHRLVHNKSPIPETEVDISTVSIELSTGGREIKDFFLVPNRGGRGLYGIYILYPENENTIGGTLKAAQVFKKEPVKFERNNLHDVELMLEPDSGPGL